jgi:hypothetical protein
MSTPTLPVSDATLQVLRELTEQTGLSALEILDKALDDYRRKVFFQGLAVDYAALKADPEAWADELAERKLWDATLMDGLDPDEQWTEDGRSVNPDPPQEKAP